MPNIEEKKICSNCHGMAVIEVEESGVIDCFACGGKGYIEIIKKVDHYEPGADHE